MESILQQPQWPASLSQFVIWCLMWDPKNRPTSMQALNHEYFADAVDPLRPKSSTSRLLGRKMSDKSFRASSRDATDSPTLTSKSSWFRRSLIGRSESPAPLIEEGKPSPAVPRPAVISYNTISDMQPVAKVKSPPANKRATWANGAPMPILPSIRPVSPLSNAVTAQANSTVTYATDPHPAPNATTKPTAETRSTSKKIGRQLSVNSNGNHYADIHRQEAERALNGLGSANTAGTQKESFFSHLRKRARRLSGRNQAAQANYDVEANPGYGPWSNRSSATLDAVNIGDSNSSGLSELDKALQNVRYEPNRSIHPVQPTSTTTLLKRLSMPTKHAHPANEVSPAMSSTNGPVPSRVRRAYPSAHNPAHRYETPEEEDELLEEVLHSTQKAARQLARPYADSLTTASPKEDGLQTPSIHNSTLPLPNPYPTPSPSAKRNGVSFGYSEDSPVRQREPNGTKIEADTIRQWPTPPYGENEWSSSAAASIFAAAGSIWR